MMQDLLKDEYPAFLEAMNQKPSRGIRRNPLKISEEDFLRMKGDEIRKSPFARYGYYLLSDEAVKNDPARLAGLYYMQEPSASAAVTVLDPQPGMKVLDLCAAPGSKTTEIAELMMNGGFILANEIHPKRARILLENTERCGASNILVTNCTSKEIADRFTDFFDAVLCDAPCSGEGMFRKNPEAAEEWTPASPAVCAARQKEILHEAYRCLSPGGVLVYSTCTFNLQENEEVIAWFLKEHADMHAEDAGVSFGRHGFPVTGETAKAVRIFPIDGGEGHFIMRMRKEGNGHVSGSLMKSERIPPECLRFMKEQLGEAYPYLLCRRGKVYGGTAPFYETGRLHLIRDQVYLGEMKGKDFVPSHHFFMSTFSRIRNTVSLSDEDVIKYFKGEQLFSTVSRGWYAAEWNGFVVGGVKSDGRQLKNKYPSGLRI